MKEYTNFDFEFFCFNLKYFASLIFLNINQVKEPGKNKKNKNNIEPGKNLENTLNFNSTFC